MRLRNFLPSTLFNQVSIYFQLALIAPQLVSVLIKIWLLLRLEIYYLDSAVFTCNEVNTTAVFTIKDDTAPVLTAPATDLELVCGATNASDVQDWLMDNGGAEVTEACSDVVWTNDFDSQSFQEACGGTGTYVVTFTAKDDCGNMVMTNATISICVHVHMLVID